MQQEVKIVLADYNKLNIPFPEITTKAAKNANAPLLTLERCESPKKFCGLRNFTRPSIGRESRVNCSFI